MIYSIFQTEFQDLITELIAFFILVLSLGVKILTHSIFEHEFKKLRKI